MSGAVRKAAQRNQSLQAVNWDFSASGNVVGLLAQGVKLSLASLLQSMPVIVAFGDSTTSYANAQTGTPLSLINNGDGTATLTFASAQGLAVGDLISVQGCLHEEFEQLLTPVLAVAGNSYTYAMAGLLPGVVGDGGLGIAVSYPLRASGAGPISWVRALTGRRIKFINAGQNGDSLARLIARFDTDVKPFAPQRVLVSIGINDIFGVGKSLAQLQADMPILLAKCIAIGAKLDVLTPFPQPNTRQNWTPAKRDTFTAWRRWLMRWCADNGQIGVDWATCVAGSLQVQDPQSPNASPMPNMVNADLIHPLGSASYMAGATLARIYNQLYPSNGGGNASPIGVAKNMTDGGLITNPLFLGNGGIAVNGAGSVTGVIANGVTVTLAAGSGSVTCYQTARTVALDGDIAGNWQGVTLNAGAAGDQVQIRLPNLVGQVTNGDTVRVQGLARIVVGPTLIKEFSFLLNSQTQISGNLLITDLTLGTGQMAPFPEAFSLTLGADCPVRSPQPIHGPPTSFVPIIQFTAFAAGTMAIEIACWSADKL